MTQTTGIFADIFNSMTHEEKDAVFNCGGEPVAEFRLKHAKRLDELDRVTHCGVPQWAAELVAADKETPNADDIAVDRFSKMMKEKLALARVKGRGGWQECSEDYLLDMLGNHVAKGDMRDVANIAMMIHLNRECRKS